jgi:hypothetical protein
MTLSYAGADTKADSQRLVVGLIRFLHAGAPGLPQPGDACHVKWFCVKYLPFQKIHTTFVTEYAIWNVRDGTDLTPHSNGSPFQRVPGFGVRDGGLFDLNNRVALMQSVYYHVHL